MVIDILTGFPEILSGMVNRSIMRSALRSKLVDIWVHDLRHFTQDRHGKIDDAPYGGGAGMVLMAQPIFSCVDYLRSHRQLVPTLIYMSPQGEQFDQKAARELASHEWIVLLCGHYKDVDARVFERYDWREVSVGDFVVSGGEIPAALVADAVVRLVPGVLGDDESARSDSFESHVLDSPYFTKPPELLGLKVPDVLLSGDHAKIAEWRAAQRSLRTKTRRPDMLDRTADHSKKN